MAPSKEPTSWDDEDSGSDSSSSPPSPKIVASRRKFDDEEDEDNDVLESWDAAEDSEVEREKAKKSAEAKAKADAEAKANHKSKSQRIEEKRQETLRRQQEQELEESSEDEDEADKRARLSEAEKAADLKTAEELFGGAGTGPAPERRAAAVKAVTVQESADPASAIDLTKLKLFSPTTVAGFNKMRDALVPLITANTKKAQYEMFLKDFTKQLAQGMTSEQIKKVTSVLTTLGNEKMREEKEAQKGGKKTKAAKTKASLSAARDISMRADTTLYDDDGLDDGDFM